MYKAKPLIVSKKKRKNVEVVSASKAPSSIKNRSSTKKDKGKILEPKAERIEEQPNQESNLNETLHSQEEENLEKPLEAPMMEIPISKMK